MPVDARKTLTDAGYIAVGLAVLGYQQTTTRLRDLQTRLAEQGECVSGSARDLRGRVAARGERLGVAVAETRERAVELGTELTKRVEPLVDQARGSLGDVPQQLAKAVEPVAKVVEPVAARVRSRLVAPAA